MAELDRGDPGIRPSRVGDLGGLGMIETNPVPETLGKTKISVRIDNEILAWLDRTARKNFTDRSKVMNQVLGERMRGQEPTEQQSMLEEG